MFAIIIHAEIMVHVNFHLKEKVMNVIVHQVQSIFKLIKVCFYIEGLRVTNSPKKIEQFPGIFTESQII